MGDFFKRNRLRFLLCILALLIGVLLYAAMQGGQTTGVMGVVLSEILLIPGNMLIQKISNGTNVVARLPLNAALVLIVLATVLTILGGFIPAKGASRSDPVKALRSE